MLGRSYDIQSGQLNNVEKVILKMLGQSVGQSTYMNDWNSLWLQGKSGVVRRTLTPSFQGSNPCSPARMRVFQRWKALFLLILQAFFEKQQFCIIKLQFSVFLKFPTFFCIFCIVRSTFRSMQK